MCLAIRTLLVLIALLAPSLAGAAVPYWDLRHRSADPGQVDLFNPDAGDGRNGVPVEVVDLNGDGRDEVVISAFNGDGPRGEAPREAAGEVRILFWGPGRLQGQLDLGRPDPRVLEITGARAGDYFGCALAVGDLDDDGYEDLIVGAFGSGEPGREIAGRTYIVYGSSQRGGGSRVDLADGLPPDVSVILGSDADDRLGVWNAAGDVDGDGVDDLVLGADRAVSPAGKPETGKILVVRGPILPGSSLDLATHSGLITVIHGVDAYDHFGATTASADLDGDGHAEIVGAAASHHLSRNTFDGGGSGDGPPGVFRQDAGEAWIVWGSATLPDTIDLAETTPAATTAIYGRDWQARCGEELETGDVNGDGTIDLLVGSLSASGPPGDYRRNGGEGYVFYGGSHLRNRVVDMAAPDVPLLVVYGTNESIAGDSFSAGDINGDGYDDLLVGLPHDRGPTDRDGGTVAIVYGGPALPPSVDLADPSVPVTWLEGVDRFDDTAYWSAAGDVNGDGYDEAIVNAMSGAGWRNHAPGAGDCRIVSGFRLTAHPSPPRRLVARAHTDHVRVSWSPPAGEPVDGYRLSWWTDADRTVRELVVADTTVSFFHIRNRTPRTFRVRALRGGYASRAAPTARVTPFSPPSPAVSVRSLDAGRVEVSWTPVEVPGRLGYLVYRRTDPTPPTPGDRIGAMVHTETRFMDENAPAYRRAYYWVTTLLDGFLESDFADPVPVFSRPERAGQGILLVNDYDWTRSSDGPYTNFFADPWEMYAARTLTGLHDFTFWDFREPSWFTTFPPGHEPVGHGPLDGDVLFDHGVVMWVAHGPDGPNDSRFEEMMPLLREFHAAGGVLFLIGWQMGSYLPPGLQDLFHIRDWERPNAVLPNRLLLPAVQGYPVIGPGPGLGSAPLCDVPRLLDTPRVRVLHTLDFPGSPPLIVSGLAPEGYDRTLLLSASPSYLDPLALRNTLEPILSRLAGARSQVGLPPAVPPRLPGPAYPNPTRAGARIDFTLDTPGPGQGRVLDVQGRLVRTLHRGPLAAGPGTLSWDGRDETGRPTASGVYFLHLATPGFTVTRRVLRIP